MKKSNILEKLDEKKITPEKLAELAIKNETMFSEIFRGLSSEKPRIKYGSSKALLIIARNASERLYPHFDFFVKLLENESNILKWTAIDILGLFANVDKKRKLPGFAEKIFGFLSDGNMITANHTIAALANIVCAYPDLKEKITKELLKVEDYKYDTEECRNIAIGKVILAMGSCFEDTNSNKEVLDFVKRQAKNRRPSTVKKAKEFLSKKMVG